MNLGDLNKVWEIRALKKPGVEEARRILDQVAKQVQPIMRRRKWRVKMLSEFCPSDPRLLGLNVGGGVEVKLRLRRHNRDWEFFPFEQILDTMLHELCHIEISPHNTEFYKLWDEIRKECEELVAKGITGTGQGFDTPGRRLGGFSHNPPLPSLRQAALAASEKRARTGALLPSGPKRLGGNSEIMTALSPIQAAAMAAERRMRDDLWCGSVSHEISSAGESNDDLWEHPTSTKEGESSKSSDVTQLSDNCELRDSCPSEKGLNSSHVGSLYGSSSSPCAADDVEDKVIWECSGCTLFNQPLALICEACGTQKPKAAGSRFKTWSCKFCTLENNIKLDKCSACGQWRYSYGQPVSSSVRSYGT